MPAVTMATTKAKFRSGAFVRSTIQASVTPKTSPMATEPMPKDGGVEQQAVGRARQERLAVVVEGERAAGIGRPHAPQAVEEEDGERGRG